MTAYVILEGLVLGAVVSLVASIVWQTIEIRQARRNLEMQRDQAITSIGHLTEKLKAAERDRAAGTDPTPPEDRVESGRPTRVPGAGWVSRP
jgi:hypothetical protein